MIARILSRPLRATSRRVVALPTSAGPAPAPGPTHTRPFSHAPLRPSKSTLDGLRKFQSDTTFMPETPAASDDLDAATAADADADADAHSAAATVATITPTERQVFAQIFSSLSNTKKQSMSQLFAKGSGGKKHRGAPARRSLDRDQVLRMYPPSLRRAVEEKLLADKSVDDDAVEPQELSDEEKLRIEQLAARRAAEVDRVAALMHAAPTDTAVWRIMEDEVFALVDKLGIHPLSKGKPTANPKADPANFHMEVHGAVFAQHMVTGVTVLADNFAQPSALVPCVLPRLKELGLGAYMLGVSTPLFDRLLRLSWAASGSVSLVIKMLGDMAEAGLEYGPGTLAAIDEVAREMGQMRAQEGNFAEMVLTQPAFDMYARKALMAQYEKIELAVRNGQKEGILA